MEKKRKRKIRSGEYSFIYFFFLSQHLSVYLETERE